MTVGFPSKSAEAALLLSAKSFARGRLWTEYVRVAVYARLVASKKRLPGLARNMALSFSNVGSCIVEIRHDSVPMGGREDWNAMERSVVELALSLYRKAAVRLQRKD